MKKKFYRVILVVSSFFLGWQGTAVASGIDQVKQFESLQNAQAADTRFADYYEKLKQNPKDLAAHLALGKLYADKKLYELALNSFRRILSLDPQYAEAHYQMSLIYQALNFKKLQLAELQEAVQKAPQQDQYHYHLGVLYMKEGHYDFKSAKEEYKNLKKMNSPLAQKLGRLMGLEE
jgi:superkiller protein 3